MATGAIPELVSGLYFFFEAKHENGHDYGGTQVRLRARESAKFGVIWLFLRATSSAVSFIAGWNDTNVFVLLFVVVFTGDRPTEDY